MEDKSLETKYIELLERQVRLLEGKLPVRYFQP